MLCHPSAVRHLVDPSYLTAAVTKVYGKAKFKELYGELLPCEPSRVRAVGDNETVELGPERTLRFYHVSGHARHHMVVWDGLTRSVFTGDAFGVRYPWLELYNVRESFYFPSTPPSEFSAAEQREGVERILALKPRRAYLTHYGMAEDLEKGARQLRDALDFHEVVQRGMEKKLIQEMEKEDSREGDLEASLMENGKSEIRRWLEDALREKGLSSDDGDFWGFFNAEVDLNAQGLLCAAKKRIKDNPSGVREDLLKERKPERVKDQSPQEPVGEVDDEEPTLVAPENTSPITPKTLSVQTPISQMTKDELEISFRELGLERYCNLIREQELDGFVFSHMLDVDMRKIFPNLSYGAFTRLRLLRDRDASLEK